MNEVLKSEFQRIRTVFFHYGKIIVGGMCLATIFFFIYGALKTNSLTFEIVAAIFTTIGGIYLAYALIYAGVRYFKGNENPIFSSFAIVPDFHLNLNLVEQLKRSAVEIQKSDEETQKDYDSVSKHQSKYEKDSVRASFDFPEEIETQANQYLLYFATFLKDLGINATSNLKEEAGKVLFSVTPTDDIEALDKIREALALYLNLPSSLIVYNESFAAARLQHQIENLQHSQRIAVRELQFNENLLIAQSEIIHVKNITISQQQSIIEQQNKIIEKISSKSIMVDSIENKEELEEIYEGLKIGESKFLKQQLGIHLNPVTIVRSIAKTILEKDTEKKSVLDLNDED